MVKKNEVKFKKRKGVGYILFRNGNVMSYHLSLNAARTKMGNSPGKNFEIAKIEGDYTRV